VLRLLKIDIPSAPSPMTVITAMRETSKVTSNYTTNQITSLKQNFISERKRNVFKIVNAIIVACYRESSPFLPLVTCAMVNYSLQNGVCEESATAFVVYGYFKVFLEEKFEEAKRYGDVSSRIDDGNSPFTSSKYFLLWSMMSGMPLLTFLILILYLAVTLYGFLQFWFIPHREVASILLETYEAGMRVGDAAGPHAG